MSLPDSVSWRRGGGPLKFEGPATSCNSGESDKEAGRARGLLGVRSLSTIGQVKLAQTSRRRTVALGDLHRFPPHVSLSCCKRLPTCLAVRRLPVFSYIQSEMKRFRIGNRPRSRVSLESSGW